MHIHHRIPRANGGSDADSNLCALCPGCHDALHNAAHKLLNKKYNISAVVDALALIYPNNLRAQRICLELAIHVRDAIIRSREEGNPADHLYPLSTALLKSHKDHLVLRCKEMNLSQEEYLRLLVLRDIKTRFSLNLDPIAESRLVKAIKSSRARTLSKSSARKT